MTEGDYVYYQQKILNISTLGELRIFMLEVLQEIYKCLEEGRNDGDINICAGSSCGVCGRSNEPL